MPVFKEKKPHVVAKNVDEFYSQVRISKHPKAIISKDAPIAKLVQAY